MRATRLSRASSARSTPGLGRARPRAGPPFGEPDGAEVRRGRWARNRSLLPRCRLVDAVRPVDGLFVGVDGAGDDAVHRHASRVDTAQWRRWAAVSAPAARRPPARRARAPLRRCGRPARGRRRRPGALLAAERSAVRQRRRRDPPWCAPRRVRLEVGGLHPPGDEPDPARGEGRQLRRPREVGGGAPPLHLRRDHPGLVQRLGHDPLHPGRHGRRRSEPGGRGTATSASRGARSSANPPSPSGISAPDPLRHPAFELGPARRAGTASGGRGAHLSAGTVADRLVDRLPARAAAQVGGERPVEIDAPGRPLRLRRSARRARRSRACRSRIATRRGRRTRPRARRVRGRRGLRPS